MYLVQSWVLISIYWKKRFLWWVQRDSSILYHQYKEKRINSHDVMPSFQIKAIATIVFIFNKLWNVLKCILLTDENFIQFILSKPIPYSILSIISYTSTISPSQPWLSVHYERGDRLEESSVAKDCYKSGSQIYQFFIAHKDSQWPWSHTKYLYSVIPTNTQKIMGSDRQRFSFVPDKVLALCYTFFLQIVYGNMM